ncbi:hypothetical protein K501DRAFT_35498 [Backusella circina FSU 941]|nr:hypothetical protein K501DRAFT_35498 [Backusella circina FSU 941]
MLAAKMELKAPPPKPPIQLSLVIQEYKAPKSSNKLENAYDAPKQPQIPHYSPFMLADLEATDSESSYSSDEGDTGQVLPIKNPNGNGSPQDKKKTVSFSDKVMIIPDYIYEEEECKPVPSEKKHSVQNIMTNINKMNSKKRDKPMKQTAQSPQRLSNKLLDFFQQKRIFTSDKSSYPSVKANLDTKPEPLTHLTKNRPRKPSSMRKSREVKIVL